MSRKLTAVVVLMGLVTFAFGLLFLAHASQTAYSFHWRLRSDNAVRTTARAEDFRISTSSRSHTDQFHLRYVFRVPGEDTDHSFSNDIWFIDQGDEVDVPRDVWDRSRERGEIDVEYLESDPAVNQPVEARRGWGTVAMFAVLGLIMVVPGALLLVGPLVGRRRRVRCAIATEPTGPFVE
ncbi:MAG: hypothetical protein JWL76_2029 [Thermoleophilia bacterium]|nr:hypothetical protein [Thermoleophilia bacterium]